MLPDNEGVVGKVCDVGSAVFLEVLVEQQPSHVCMPHYVMWVSNEFAKEMEVNVKQRHGYLQRQAFPLGDGYHVMTLELWIYAGEK